MKILIVAVFFPPQNSVASLRPYSWAKYWGRWGHDVTVLTTPKPSSGSNSPMSFEGFDLLEVPVPGLDAIRTVIGESGVDSRQEHCHKAPVCWRPTVGAVVRRSLTTIQKRYGAFNLCRLPDKHDLWAWRGLSHVSGEKWDVVVTTGGPYSVHIVGYGLKRRALVKRWCLDWRDLWVDNHIYPGLPIIRSVERWIENVFHRQADIVTTVSEPLALVLEPKAKGKVRTIYNGFEPDDYESLSRKLIFPDDGIFRIVYTGTIYPGKRDPTPLFRAIHLLSDRDLVSPARLQVITAGHDSDVTGLAQEEGVGQYVQYAGFVPRSEALRMQRDANALLFLEFDAPGVRGILTGKLFEYLYAGPPIIAVGISETSSAGRIIEETGRGRAYGRNVEWLAASLVAFLHTDHQSTNAGSPAISPEILRFSRSEQAARLLKLISPEQ